MFSLGDKSYEFSCQSGKDFDSKLAELGGERLLDRVDADVEYQAAASEWRAAWLMRLNRVRLSRLLRNPSLLAR